MNTTEKTALMERVVKDLKLVIMFDEADDRKLVDKTLEYIRVVNARIRGLERATKTPAVKVVTKPTDK